MEATLSCNEARSAVPLYVGGDLDGGEARAIERHLAGCAPCRAELESAAAARSALRRLDAATPPVPEIWSGVRRRLIDEGILRAPEAPRGAAPARRIDLRRWVPTAAAAILLAALGLVLSQRADREGGGVDELESAPVAGVVPRGELLPEPEPGSPSREPELVPAQSFAQPVALRPLAFDEWPSDEAMETELQRLPIAPFAPRSDALSASLPPGGLR